MKTVRIGVAGATGRMGRRVAALAALEKGTALSCALASSGSAFLGRDAGELAGVGPLGVPVRDRLQGGDCDVLIDFSVAAALPRRLGECVRTRTPWVVATTGFSKSFGVRLARAARRVPVLVAPNTSLGAHVLRTLAREAAAALAALPPDVEIVETHHAAKRDAPSGTALWLAEAVEAGLGRSLRRRPGRAGATGPRPAGEIGLHAVRAGQVVGEHTVLFGIGPERIELIHRADSRDAFARGALQAARFLAGRKPGLYAMEDVVAWTRSRPA